jgi:hypothetical protein
MTWKKLWPIRVLAGSGGVASWLAKTRPGVKIVSKITGRAVPKVGVGVGVSQSPTKALTQVVTGLAVATDGVGTVVPVVGGGVNIESTLSGIVAEPTTGAQVKQVTYNLLQTSGATGATDTGTWANPTQAQGPAPDGLSASNGQSGITNASGKLTLTYAPQFGKTELEITSVELRFYWNASVPLAGANPPINKLFYGLAGVADIELFSSTVANSRLVNAQVFDITSAVGQDWDKLTNLATGASMTTSLALPASTTVIDAVVLVVTANQTIINT